MLKCEQAIPCVSCGYLSSVFMNVSTSHVPLDTYCLCVETDMNSNSKSSRHSMAMPTFHDIHPCLHQFAFKKRCARAVNTSKAPDSSDVGNVLTSRWKESPAFLPSVDIQHTLAFILTSISTALSPPPLHTARRWARPFSASEMQPHTFSASLSARPKIPKPHATRSDEARLRSTTMILHSKSTNSGGESSNSHGEPSRGR
jgi:hypothetical protein